MFKFLFLIMVLVTPLFAGNDHPCQADEQKYCGNLGGMDKRNCMMQNKDKFSAACKEKIKARMTNSTENGKGHPCEGDRQKLCNGMTIGKGLFKCLKEHQSELSAGCQAKMKEHHRGPNSEGGKGGQNQGGDEGGEGNE